jgi:tRNA A37 threonylcarbamoyladenosine synthetase subunit TsaC/SUA5/YrdC
VSSENTLGFRITTDKKLQEIVRQLGAPITATSAQIYGNKIPYSLGFLKKIE